MRTFTDEELILFIYQEAEAGLKRAIELALVKDINLQSRVHLLRNTADQLKQLKPQSPSTSVVQKILEYSRKKNKP